MRNILIIILLVCACTLVQAQTNFVKNPGLEQYYSCPDEWNQINYCKYWSIPGDSITTKEYCLEYYNVCAGADPDAGIPESYGGYQYPHSGYGMAGALLYYDKTSPPPFGLVPFNYRDNLVGRLYTNLTSGKIYCISFWINMAERSGVAQNKIGAYLDDGSINIVDTFGEEISDVQPQVFTNEVIKDTLHWTKIEGSFTASGTEKYITLGNFFPNDSVNTVITNYRAVGEQASYYFIDDVSVIPIDLNADAGTDSHAEPGKSVLIGRVGDTTAMGLDCKWYYKGALIDSGAIISVKGSAIVGTVDTYVVVQTVCGLVKNDTVTVTTVPVGMKEWKVNQTFTVYPNPSSGAFTISFTAVIPNGTKWSEPASPAGRGTLHATVYDVLGRIVVQHQMITFSNNTATLNIQAVPGVYMLELADEAGNADHQRIVIE